MSLKDGYGNAVSTSSDQAVTAYDQGVDLFLSANYGAVESFQASVEADDSFALGHAGLARAAMMGGDMTTAKSAIIRAQELASSEDKRCQQHVEAMALLLSGRAAEARAKVKAHMREFPRDAMAAQMCASVFGLIGFSGEVGREAELLAYTSDLLPHYEGDWWMMSMHAISLCETGQADKSLDLMEQSLAINPRNANGSHFKAHAQYESGNVSSGRKYLDDWLEDYDNRGVLHGHLSWHSALWALHDGDAQAMWNRIDTGAAPGTSRSLPLNVLTDTAAIMYRAELAGMEVDPARWSQMSDYAAQYFPETGQSFADIHAALSHAMAGEGERLAHIVETAKGFAADLVKPVARAWGAIARQEWQTAVDELVPVMATHERFGGSRAQRDLLELAMVNALMKLGRTDEARRSLSMRRPVLAPNPPIQALN
ncbi:MAG: tetratricopeptide repeat protein [Rhizobiaceae bacterium]